jgi:hypothetical protein
MFRLTYKHMEAISSISSDECASKLTVYNRRWCM